MPPPSSARRLWAGILLLAVWFVFTPAASSTAAPGPLRVGAARVDITPPLLPMANGMPETLVSHLYVRAIVLDNGQTRAALINADQVVLSEEIWSSASQRIAAILHCPAENIILSAIHVHSDGSDMVRGFRPSGPRPPAAKFPSVAGAAVEAVREAYSRLQPAKVGFATEEVYLNVNRDGVSQVTHRWSQIPNLQSPSDKTLAVVTFATPAGQPIAIYFNYAMHPIDYWITGAVSSDFPGDAAHDLESQFPGAVAVFTQGASGNQNPLYLEPRLQLREAEAGEPTRNITDAYYQSESNAFPPLYPWVPSREPEIKKAMTNLNAWVQAEGEVISQAVMRAIRYTHYVNFNVGIEGAQTMISCPGRKRTNQGRQGVPGVYVDAPAVPIRLGLLRIGPIAIGRVDGEIFTQIGERLKKESPLKNTMVVTLADGRAPSGYIYDDGSYTEQTFQVLGSNLKPGCAEDGIVNGILSLMPASLR